MPEVSLVKSNYINVAPMHIKKSTPFTCIGWISNIQIPDEYPMVLLAVSDMSGVVESDRAMRFEIKRYKDSDYKLQFSNSESKPIEQYTGVSLDDKKWHMISYVCTGEGQVHYYIDGIECPPEDGVNTDGMLYSIAWSRFPRLGGGNVWVPYLYRDWQEVMMYRWRYSSGLVLHQQWLNEIMQNEKGIFVPRTTEL